MTIQEAKQRFWLMRNGIVADALRRAMPGWRTIYGLTLPQVREIAADAGADEALAEALWADTGVREASLLAPMVMPLEAMTPERALAWVAREPAPTAEAVDVLCHSLLRRLPGAAALALGLEGSGAGMGEYAALRLMLNLLPGELEAAKAMAARHPAHPLGRRLADECAFIEEGL